MITRWNRRMRFKNSQSQTIQRYVIALFVNKIKSRERFFHTSHDIAKLAFSHEQTLRVTLFTLKRVRPLRPAWRCETQTVSKVTTTDEHYEKNWFVELAWPDTIYNLNPRLDLIIDSEGRTFLLHVLKFSKRPDGRLAVQAVNQLHVKAIEFHHRWKCEIKLLESSILKIFQRK